MQLRREIARMDVPRLFCLAQIRRIRNHIFLEIHETLTSEDTIKSYKLIQSMIENFIFDRQLGDIVDWIKVREAFEKQSGAPTLIAEISAKTT